MIYRSVEIPIPIVGNGNLSFHLYLLIHYFHQLLLVKNYCCLTAFDPTEIVFQLFIVLAIFSISLGLGLLSHIAPPMLIRGMSISDCFKLNSRVIAYPNSIFTLLNFDPQILFL